MDIPVSARVECTDGLGGESTAIIVNPVTRELTHFVVQDASSPSKVQRMVPVDQISETTETTIRLSCTRDELSKMEPFVETHYIIDEERADYTHWTGGEVWQEPYATTEGADYVAVEEEHIPAGERAIHRGAQVEASDGHIGEVDEFLVDPHGERITHLVLRERHLLGKSEVTLPVSAIDRVEGDTIYLKLDKKAVESLPGIPVKRPAGKGERESNIELLARVFDDPDRANESLEFVQDLHKRKVLKVLYSATLVKDKDGNTTLKETGDVDAKHGRIAGAITGGLVGLIGGPIGVVVGALAGAGVGGLAAKWIDMGFSDEFLEVFQKQLEPGCAAVLVVVEDEWAVKASEALADDKNLVFQQTLTDEMVQKLLDAGKEEAGE
jgi:uncharacterized membrane protein